MKRSLRLATVFAGLAGLSACGDAPQATPALEVLQPAPLDLWIDASGELKAAKATKLVVPGQNWAQRQLVWMVPDGSPVKAGDVVAVREGAKKQLRIIDALKLAESAAWRSHVSDWERERHATAF